MSRILLGVSGGIAAYKSLELVRLLTAAGHAVRVIRTEAAAEFVGDQSFAAITGAPVLWDEFAPDPARGAFPGDQPPPHQPISHLAVVGNADIFVIAPATANTIADLAGGHASSLLLSAALAATCPVVVAPAMNHHMWHHPATRANVELLRARGLTVLEPGSGRLASIGEEGDGRLPEPAEIVAAIEAQSSPALGHWAGLRVLVTAGGTREPIDSVRFVGNRSSGKMGWAIAAEAARRGAHVDLVAANVALPAPAGVNVIPVSTAAELGAAVAVAFPGCDVLFMTAAVADFRPADAVEDKLKREGREEMTLTLERTDDVLAACVAARRPGQLLVGFAAEHGDRAVELARGKLERKRVDAVVVNDISDPAIGFESDENEMTIVTPADDEAIPRGPKPVVAAAILDAAERLRETAAQGPTLG